MADTTSTRNRPEIALFRSMRRAIGATQQELADWSADSGLDLSRDFVANLENAGLPGTVRKFLAYWNVTRFDMELLAEQALIDHLDRPPERSPDDVLDECHKLTVRGNPRASLSLALSAAHAAKENEDPRGHARYMIAAATAAVHLGQWRYARDRAELALESGALDLEDQALARFTMAHALFSGDRERSALSVLESIDHPILDAYPSIRGMVLFLKGQCHYVLDEHRKALVSFDHALRVIEDGSYYRLSMAASGRAKTLMALGRLEEATRAAQDAVRYADDSGNPQVRCGTHITLAKSFVKAGKIKAAREVLRVAEALALEHRFDHLLVHVRIVLFEIKILNGPHHSMAGDIQRIRKEMRRSKVSRELVTYFDNLLARHPQP